MKTPPIFVTSTSEFRGLRLASKAGFFYVPAKGVFLPIKRRLAFTERLRNVFARESGLVDSGIRQAAFLSAYVNKSHHAHRNSHTAGKEKPLQRAADHPRPQRRTRQTHGARIAPFAPGFSAKEKAGFNSLSP